MAGGWWLVAGGWSGKPKKGTGHGTSPNGAKRVATGRDALLRDPAWRVIEGWITTTFWNAQYRTPNVLPSWKTSPIVGSDGDLPYHTSDRPNATSHYFAPMPNSTAGIVLSRILRSSQIDQLSMYLRSSFTHVSNSFTSLRPLICHRQVIPGLTLRRRR